MPTEVVYMSGRWLFIRFLALFIFIALLGFFVGYTYSMDASKTYTNIPNRDLADLKK
jgi:hypothetical protein